jgi:thiol-disulfide isomerase/thioredoxin
MIAEGPSANLPPHIALEPCLLLSRSLKLIVLGHAAVIGAVMLGGCDRQSGQDAQPQASESAPKAKVPAGAIDRSHRGSLIPEFVLTDGKNKELRLSSLKGKPLLINLWATWCRPCITELPLLNKLAEDRKGDLRVLAVSQDSQELGRVAPFLTDRGLNALEPWIEPKNDLSFHYQTGQLPTTIYYDAEGREVWRYVGERDWTDSETADMLKETV